MANSPIPFGLDPTSFAALVALGILLGTRLIDAVLPKGRTFRFTRKWFLNGDRHPSHTTMSEASSARDLDKMERDSARRMEREKYRDETRDAQRDPERDRLRDEERDRQWIRDREAVWRGPKDEEE